MTNSRQTFYKHTSVLSHCLVVFVQPALLNLGCTHVDAVSIPSVIHRGVFFKPAFSRAGMEKRRYRGRPEFSPVLFTEEQRALHTSCYQRPPSSAVLQRNSHGLRVLCRHECTCCATLRTCGPRLLSPGSIVTYQ